MDGIASANEASSIRRIIRRTVGLTISVVPLINQVVRRRSLRALHPPRRRRIRAAHLVRNVADYSFRVPRARKGARDSAPQSAPIVATAATAADGKRAALGNSACIAGLVLAFVARPVIDSSPLREYSAPYEIASTDRYWPSPSLFPSSPASCSDSRRRCAHTRVDPNAALKEGAEAVGSASDRASSQNAHHRRGCAFVDVARRRGCLIRSYARIAKREPGFNRTTSSHSAFRSRRPIQ
jgi:hypothetical protein